jgi:DNA mismatch repair protein MutS2
MRCGEGDLTGLGPAAGAPPPSSSGARITQPAAPGVEPELKLLGRRVDEALSGLDEYLDRALLSGREEVRVVHGHGTGRLREAVRQHLTGHRAVAEHRPGGEGEGGDGATVVTLRV